jgi:PEGA domain-containing protein
MRAISVTLICVLLSGCAHLFNGTTQGIAVSSAPPGARILVRGQAVGVTPTKITLPRRDSRLVLRFEKDGYQPAEVPLKRSVSGWIVGDIVLGPMQLANQGLSSTSQQAAAALIAPSVFLAVDFLTGAAYKLPAQVRVVLQPAR